MPAGSKAELIDVTQKEWRKLERLMDALDPALVTVKDADDVSIKDILGHRAHWIDLFFGWYHDGRAGRPVHFPAEGYKWNQLPAYNAKLRIEQAGLSWDEVRTLLSTRSQALLDFLEARTDTELYAAPMQGGRNDWTTGRWAEAAGPSHFRSAAKYIRARQKAAKTAG